MELVDFKKDKESWDMDTLEKIEAARKKKEDGNLLYKLEKYVRASNKYEKMAKYIKYDSSFSDEQKKASQSYQSVVLFK